MSHPAPAATPAPGGADAAARAVGRWVLAAFLAFAGVSHFTNAAEFQAQVPPWLPGPEVVVAVSGVMEIALAAMLVALPGARTRVGWTVALFFVLVFPGNVSQFVTRTEGFGLDSDAVRFARLLVQPLLVVWALWCTGAWRSWRQRRAAGTGS